MKKQKEEDYALRLKNAYERWEYLYNHGGSDPFWADGVNLNIVRNHILFYRDAIEKTKSLDSYPSDYYKEVPPEVEQDYMARADEIRVAAKAALERYKADPNYLYIIKHYNDFTQETRSRLSIDNILGYVSGLQNYIKEDKLVDMRRHERCEHYLQSFEECANKMQSTPSEDVQLSFFTTIPDNIENFDADDCYDDCYDMEM